jgi:hypothetical protein
MLRGGFKSKKLLRNWVPRCGAWRRACGIELEGLWSRIYVEKMLEIVKIVNRVVEKRSSQRIELFMLKQKLVVAQRHLDFDSEEFVGTHNLADNQRFARWLWIVATDSLFENQHSVQPAINLLKPLSINIQTSSEPSKTLPKLPTKNHNFTGSNYIRKKETSEEENP